MILLILLLLGGNHANYRSPIQEVAVFEQREEAKEDIEGIYRAKVSFYDESYCRRFNPACITASGERFRETDMSCACSNNYDIGSHFRFSFNGNSVVARCNDRGSFKEKYGRDFDLSKGAFEALAPISRGVLTVEIEEL